MLQAIDLTKRYEDGNLALDALNLEIKPGEIFFLLGANGAGKTTSINIFLNFIEPTSGHALIDGIDVMEKPLETKKHVAFVSENVMLYGNFTARQNLDFFARLGGKTNLTKDDYYNVMRRVGLQEEAFERKLKTFSKGMRQKVGLAIAIIKDADNIVMDEPTAAITDREVELLFEHIRSLTAKGVAIIYISHRMDEIFSICDRVSVYRDGQYIGSGDTKDLDEAQLIKMMVGREITDVFPKLEAEIGDVVFEAKNIVRADNKVKGVSLSVRRGEILGIGGLVGAGRSELVEGIFGMHELASGEIFVKGKQVKVHSPKDIIKEGVALITEDRKVTGLNLSGSVNDNIAMVAIKKLLSHGLYNKNKARAASMEYIKKLNIKTPSGDQITGNLSGGNQQKIVIAKWLLNDPDIIILDEPTRGIDVGAKRDIYLLLGKLVQQGKAVIMISSEIPELMGVCDRIMVMCEGNLSGEVQRDAFSQERIMTLASAIEV